MTQMDTDYIVTDEVRKLWAKEIEIYLHFRAFCEKHNLKHYATGGSLLGAARHKGFIPWDDDMDFVMPHEDYQKFLELGAKEFTDPYRLVSHVTDPVYGGITCSSLRRTDTFGCSKWEYENIVLSGEKNATLGIWIHLFPLSYVPEDEETRAVQKAQIMDVWKAIRGFGALKAIEEGRTNYNHDYEQYIEIYQRNREKNTLQEMKQLYLDLCGQNKEPTKFVGVTAIRTFQPNLVWNTEWFADSVELPFENITVTAPVGYEQVLTKQFGDWRTPVQNTAYHEMFAFDADTPYREAIKKYQI